LPENWRLSLTTPIHPTIFSPNNPFTIMKSSFFSILAAASLLATTSFAAAPAAFGHDGRPTQQNPNDRLNDRNDKDFNYGFDKKHKVSPDERKRWEEAHKNDRKDDRKDYKEDRKDDRKDDHRDGKDNNYGFDKNHRVTPEERARWEAAHKNDRRDDHR
jgi:hypothetical protein